MHVHRFAQMTLLVMLACFLNTTGASSQQQGKLLWQDTVDLGPFDQAFDVAAADGQVFAVGFVGVGGARDFFVKAYTADTGTLLWQDRVDRGPNDYAAGVTVSGGTVFVAGAAGSSCCPDWAGVSSWQGALWMRRITGTLSGHTPQQASKLSLVPAS